MHHQDDFYDLLSGDILSDVRTEDHDEGQSQEPLRPTEVQEFHKVMRNQLKDQVSCNLILSNTISNLLNLVT